MTGSAGELLAAWIFIKIAVFVSVRSFDDGSSLLSGRADENAQSSSSSAIAAVGAGVDFAVDEAPRKSKRELEGGGTKLGFACLAEDVEVRAANGSMLALDATTECTAFCC